MATSEEPRPGTLLAAPGTERPRRYLPKLRYELIGCGLHGHELLGTDAAALRAEDGLVARDSGGLRWYRGLRCDSWVALSPPEPPRGPHPPSREQISLPWRRRTLRDRYVLRLIAIDRVIHFLVLSALATAIFLFATNKAALNADFTKILNDLQGGLSGSVNSNHGIVHDLHNLFAISIANLYVAGTAVAAYAVLEGTEAVGLWLGRRWAEYLTFLATVVFVPYETYELTKSVSALKVLALVINLAIVAYLLIAKRLFGLRGGGKAERAEHEEDTGWAPIERATPVPRQGSLAGAKIAEAKLRFCISQFISNVTGISALCGRAHCQKLGAAGSCRSKIGFWAESRGFPDVKWARRNSLIRPFRTGRFRWRRRKPGFGSAGESVATGGGTSRLGGRGVTPPGGG